MTGATILFDEGYYDNVTVSYEAGLLNKNANLDDFRSWLVSFTGYQGVFDMRVIIINGPMGVGITVTGKRIAEKNPGTAFIDGDWCMDINPFVGNRETKAMTIDNICI